MYAPGPSVAPPSAGTPWNDCTTPLAVVDSYFTAAFLQGNLSKAMTYTVNDASFAFSWQSATPGLEALGFRSNYTGKTALYDFFGTVLPPLNDAAGQSTFGFGPQSVPDPVLSPFIGGGTGFQTLATRCNVAGAPDVIIKTWKEVSIYRPTSGVVDDGINTAVYTMADTGSGPPTIQTVDVYVSTLSYYNAFDLTGAAGCAASSAPGRRLTDTPSVQSRPEPPFAAGAELRTASRVDSYPTPSRRQLQSGQPGSLGSCSNSIDLVDAYLLAAFAHGNLSAASGYTVADSSFRFRWLSTTPGLEALGFRAQLGGSGALNSFFSKVLSPLNDASGQTTFSFGAQAVPTSVQTPFAGFQTLGVRCNVNGAPDGVLSIE